MSKQRPPIIDPDWFIVPRPKGKEGLSALVPRAGCTPDILRKSGPQRDRTKYHRPTGKPGVEPEESE